MLDGLTEFQFRFAEPMHRQDRRRVLDRATRVPPLEQRLADLRGMGVRYFVGGNGMPLVLVHGLGGVARNWAPLVARLAPRYRLLVPELPGHGGSAPLPATASLDAYADRVALLAQHEAVGAAVVVGHSLGALVALRLARRSPSSVLGLVLAGAAGISSTRPWARRGLAITSLVKPGRRLAPYRRAIGRRARLRRVVMSWGVSDTDSFGEVTEHFLIGPALNSDTTSAARALVPDDIRTQLDAVQCPCLVLWGARDTQVGVGDAFEFSRRLRAPLRVFADTGHLLIAERPDACADAIARFVDGLSGAARPGSVAR
jgi:pimeloyl-ACP methyl ester carboxylesterase